VNRKDVAGKNLFAGGFLGLDNIGVFDRSKPLPTGGVLTQADGTAWMAFYCTTMLSIALELAQTDPCYEDIASKFFEHFVAIVDAMNGMGGEGLWDETDGFYYDHLVLDGQSIPLRIRSMVGLIPLFAAQVLPDVEVDRLPGFSKRMRWFLENRPDLATHVYYRPEDGGSSGARLLAIAPRDRLQRILRYVLDDDEYAQDADETLQTQLERRGFRPDDVRTVVLTHLHEDHVGGLRDLPKAKVVVSQAEWDARRREWLPTAEDQMFIESLMQPVTARGKFAGWIAPPPRGINGQPIDFEYVRQV